MFYECGMCYNKTIQEVNSFQCAFCSKFFHFKCINVNTDREISLIKESKDLAGLIFVCPNCISHINSFSVYLTEKEIEKSTSTNTAENPEKRVGEIINKKKSHS